MKGLYFHIVVISLLLCSIGGVYSIKYYTIYSNNFFIVLSAIFFVVAVILGIIILRVGFE